MEIYAIEASKEVRYSNERGKQHISPETYYVIAPTLTKAIEKTRNNILKNKNRFFDDEKKMWVTEKTATVTIISAKHELTVDYK